MKPDNGRIVFFETEVNPQTGAVTDIGAADGAGRAFHSPSKNAFRDFLRDADFVCGHNVIRHDLNFVGDCLPPSAAVLTRDNATAEIIAGLLNRNGLPARLIQSNEGFSLTHKDVWLDFSGRVQSVWRTFARAIR